jgi:hypothetical protein
MADVECRLKGTEGAPGTREWKCRKNTAGCTRTKPCKSCLGRRSRRSGMTKQRQARKALEQITGKAAGRFSTQTGNEENWNLPVRAEVKSGAIAGPVWTKYAAAEAQSEATRPHGDMRPFVFIAMGTRTSDGLLVCRLSKLPQVLDALVELV